MQRQQTKPSKAQRAAQSASDKAKAGQKKGKKNQQISRVQAGVPGINNTRSTSRNVNHPSSSGRGPNGGWVIKNREYVNDFTIGGSAGVTFIQYSINPGLSALFQWLSFMALAFESYHFIKLSFLWETEAPTSIGGKVIFAFDPNVADPIPGTKQQLLTFQHKADDAVFRSFRFDIPEKALHTISKTLFIRDLNPVAGADQKLYDCGQLFIGLVGAGGGVSCLGEVHVEYEVELINPAPPPFFSDLSCRIVGSGGWSQVLPLGTSDVQTGSNAFNLNAANLSGSEIDFYVTGQFLVMVNTSGSGFVGVAPIISASRGVTASVGFTTFTGVGASYFFLVSVINTNSQAVAFIQFNQGGSATITTGLARIMPYQTTLG